MTRFADLDAYIYTVFEAFTMLLKARLLNIVDGRAELGDVSEESEENIKQLLVYVLTTVGDVDPLDIYLEYPHRNIPSRPHAKVDLFIASRSGRPAMVFEMKSFILSQEFREVPKPMIAAAAFVDILRLALFKHREAPHRYFLYIVDEHMIKYYNNPRNNLASFFNLGLNSRLKLTKEYITRNRTMIKTIASKLGNVELWPQPTVVMKYRDMIKLKNIRIAVRLYEVED